MNRCKLIVVANQKGGCGKTTLSVHLAGFLSRKGHTVAVIDPEGQLAVHTWLSKAAPDIGVLPIATVADLEAKLPQLLDKCEFIVADSSPGLGDLTRALVEHADLLIVPSLSSGIDMRATMQAMKVFDQIGKKRGRAIDTRIVINRFNDRTKLGQSAAMSFAALGYPITTSRIQDRDAVGQASSLKVFAWDMKDKGGKAAALDFEKLAQEIIYGQGNINAGSGGNIDTGSPGHRSPADSFIATSDSAGDLAADNAGDSSDATSDAAKAA